MGERRGRHTCDPARLAGWVGVRQASGGRARLPKRLLPLLLLLLGRHAILRRRRRHATPCCCCCCGGACAKMFIVGALLLLVVPVPKCFLWEHCCWCACAKMFIVYILETNTVMFNPEFRVAQW